MPDGDSKDFFGGGLRAHLERLAPEVADASGTDRPGADDRQPPPSPVPSTLEEREQAQLEREQRFTDHVQAFEAHAAALARREEQLREREAALERRKAERRAVRDVLREHAELSVDQIIRVFDEALAATHANGMPDHAVRLVALRVLVGEAYADGSDAGAAAAALDELAQIRQRRVADAGG